jgi:hypothetical protein
VEVWPGSTDIALKIECSLKSRASGMVSWNGGPTRAKSGLRPGRCDIRPATAGHPCRSLEAGHHPRQLPCIAFHWDTPSATESKEGKTQEKKDEGNEKQVQLIQGWLEEAQRSKLSARDKGGTTWCLAHLFPIARAVDGSCAAATNRTHWACPGLITWMGRTTELTVPATSCTVPVSRKAASRLLIQ